MNRLNNQTKRVDILKALKESENLKESYLVRYFWGSETGYIKRDEEGYDRTPNESEALKFNSEDEANNAKEDMNQFFGGRAKLDVIKESSLKESSNTEDIENDLMHIEQTLQEIYGNMATREGEATIQYIYDILADKANEYGVTPTQY